MASHKWKNEKDFELIPKLSILWAENKVRHIFLQRKNIQRHGTIIPSSFKEKRKEKQFNQV